MERHERAIGCLLGLAIGEALAIARDPLEQTSAATAATPTGPTSGRLAARVLSPVDDLPKQSVAGVERSGEWGVQTAFALCLADQLLEQPGAAPDSGALLQRFQRCWRMGERTAYGRLLNLPIATAEVLAAIAAGPTAIGAAADRNSRGTDAIARVAPIALRFDTDDATVERYAAANARLTHDADVAGRCSGVFASWLALAVSGRYHPPNSAAPLVQIARGTALPDDPTHPAVSALRGALTVASEGSDFLEAMQTAYSWGSGNELVLIGALAGATRGLNAIPIQWREQIAHGHEIAELAVRLVGD